MSEKRDIKTTHLRSDSHVLQLLYTVLIITFFVLCVLFYNAFNTRKNDPSAYDAIHDYYEITDESLENNVFMPNSWTYVPNLRRNDVTSSTTIADIKEKFTYADHATITDSGCSDLGNSVVWNAKTPNLDLQEFELNGMPMTSSGYMMKIFNRSYDNTIFLDLGDINGTAYIYCNGHYVGETGDMISYEILPNYNAGHSSFALSSETNNELELIIICYSSSRITNPGLINYPAIISQLNNTVLSSAPSAWLAILMTLTAFAIIAGYFLSRTFKDIRVYIFFVLTIINVILYQIVDDSFLIMNSTTRQAARILFFISAAAFSYCFISFIYKDRRHKDSGSADCIVVSAIGIAFISLSFLDSRLLSTPYNEVAAIIYVAIIAGTNIVKTVIRNIDNTLATFGSLASVSVFFTFYAMLSEDNILCNVSLYSIFYFFSIIAICWYFINQYVNQYIELVNTSTHLKYAIEQKTAHISEINKDLVNTNRKLMENEEARKNVMSNVSHDLRTPITAIRGYAELLKNGSKTLSEEQKESYLANIVRRSQQMERIVSDIVEISKMEATNFEFEFMDVSLNEFLDELYMLYASDLPPAKKIIMDIPEDDIMIIHVDPKRFSRVFENLLSNAINYTKEEATIKIKAWRTNADQPIDNQEIHITVSDDGIGIPENEIEHIFDRFYRAKNSGQNIKGTGLGLSIVKMIIDRHDASISVESEIGIGTTFHIVIKPTY